MARAEGNAFFVEELTAAAAEPGTWVPADLADVLLVRLDRLDDDARQVVRTASASGRRVGHDVLAATSGLDADALDEGLRQAVEMNVLVAERGGYAFRHALLGEAVYDDLLPGERARLHTAYVTALEGGSARGTAAELARHARLAMNREAAVSASVRAGNEAAGGRRSRRGRRALPAGARAARRRLRARPGRPRHRPRQAGGQHRHRPHRLR